MACAWEPLIQEREREKKNKYQELAADLAKQWPGFKISVTLVVLGDLGDWSRAKWWAKQQLRPLQQRPKEK